MESSTKRNVTSKLFVGIFLLPYIFSWFTLRSGYSKKARLLSFGWLFLLFLIVLSPKEQTKKHDASEIRAEISVPYDLPKKHEPLAEATNSIVAIENLTQILNKKRPTQIELYAFVENNYEKMGVQCRHPACENVKYAMRSLKKVAENPNDVQSVYEAGQYLKSAAKESEQLKKESVYKVTQQRPLFTTDDGSYVLEYNIQSREQCKLLGDSIHINKKKTPIVFVKPGRKVSRNVAATEHENMSCVYIYNYGGKGTTRVLLGSEIEKNWY